MQTAGRMAWPGDAGRRNAFPRMNMRTFGRAASKWARKRTALDAHTSPSAQTHPQRVSQPPGSRAALPLNFDAFTAIAGLQAFSAIILACRLQAGVAASSAEPWYAVAVRLHWYAVAVRLRARPRSGDI